MIESALAWKTSANHRDPRNSKTQKPNPKTVRESFYLSLNWQEKSSKKYRKKESKGRTFQGLGKAAAGKFSRHERICGIKLRSEIAAKNADDITCREREREMGLFCLHWKCEWCFASAS